MGKKKRKRRSKKSNVTYDSKETLTFAGLIFLIISIFFAISAITAEDGSENIFIQSKQLFGDATLILSGFMLIWSLKLLGMKLAKFKTIHFALQGFLVLSLAGLFTALDKTPKEIVRLEGGGVTSGGQVGQYILENIFQDWNPASGQTVFILGLLCLILAPISLAVSPTTMGGFIGNVIGRIVNFVKVMFSPIDTEKNKDLEDILDEPLEKASRFGDFNKLLQQKNIDPKANDKDDDDDEPDKTMADLAIRPTNKPHSKESVEIKSGELGEDGLHQEELKFPDWKLPPLSLLTPFKKTKPKDNTIQQKAAIIEQILESFKIEAKVEDAYIGPSVIQYALNIPLGVNVKKVAALGENLALALGVDAKAVRIESIPETTYLGIEIPRSNRDLVRYKEIMSSEQMETSDAILPVPMGKDIHGESVIASINKMPHLLVAGATGSGKSVLTNNFICSLIMKRTPDEVKLILVDPKQVELMDYNGIPHLLTPVITDMELVVNALKWSVSEMESRYSTLAQEQVRNIEGYNKKKGFSAMPYIVIVIDEMADMMMTANRVEAENAIVRLAQKARAVGIHLILATQRPSVNVITGIIKANIPGRVGMSVTSSTDSRVILDRIGAESLMGGGDLLYKAPDKTKSVRLQCSFIEQEEIIRVVDFIKQQAPEVEYIDKITEKQYSDEEATTEVLGDISEDNLVENAIRLVVRSGKGSSSFLQRRLSIGFNRAARLLDELEEAGVVGPPNGSKPREVLISDADEFIAQLKAGL